MGISSLRYPGGEEANSYEWAPPPYTAQTKAQPVLTTGSGFPGGDWLFYDRFRGTFQSSVMSFDQLMDICAALNISEPYLVINHDSVNIGGPRASTEWGYLELKQAAVAWAQYIVQRNYTVRPACSRLLLRRPGPQLLSHERTCVRKWSLYCKRHRATHFHANMPSVQMQI